MKYQITFFFNICLFFFQPLHAPKPATSLKKDMNRKPSGAGGRSNSTLSSREVEFQNWKRRKSYDPMKAAAEGKKKEAAKKATMSSSMTQSSIMPSDMSSSRYISFTLLSWVEFL